VILSDRLREAKEPCPDPCPLSLRSADSPDPANRWVRWPNWVRSPTWPGRTEPAFSGRPTRPSLCWTIAYLIDASW